MQIERLDLAWHEPDAPLSTLLPIDTAPDDASLHTRLRRLRSQPTTAALKYSCRSLRVDSIAVSSSLLPIPVSLAVALDSAEFLASQSILLDSTDSTSVVRPLGAAR